MRFSVILVLVMAVVITGCSNVRPYTFTKERVDQVQTGNRGYIMGTPPAVAAAETPKRTMLGVDIEIPLLPGEKGYTPSSGKKKQPKRAKESVPAKKAVYEEEIVIIEEEALSGSEPSENVNFEPKKKAPEPAVQEEVIIEEEEWVK